MLRPFALVVVATLAIAAQARGETACRSVTLSATADQVGETTVPAVIGFQIPETIGITRGNAGSQKVYLRFGVGAMHVRCTYLGAPGGRAYSLNECDNGGAAGALQTADRFKLQLKSLEPGDVQVELKLGEVETCAKRVLNKGPPPSPPPPPDPRVARAMWAAETGILDDDPRDGGALPPFTAPWPRVELPAGTAFPPRVQAYLENALVELVAEHGGRSAGFVVDLKKNQLVVHGRRPEETPRVTLSDGRSWDPGHGDIGPIPLAAASAQLPQRLQVMWRSGTVHHVSAMVLGSTGPLIFIEGELPAGAVLLDASGRAVGAVDGFRPYLGASVARRLTPNEPSKAPTGAWPGAAPALGRPPRLSRPELERAFVRHSVFLFQKNELIAIGIDWFVTKEGKQAILLPALARDACRVAQCEIRRPVGPQRAALPAPLPGGIGPWLVYSAAMLSIDGMVQFQGCDASARFRAIRVNQGSTMSEGFIARIHSTLNPSQAPTIEADLLPLAIPGPVVDDATGRVVGLIANRGIGGEVPVVDCLTPMFKTLEQAVAAP
jgi:hypothetical protein